MSVCVSIPIYNEIDNIHKTLISVIDNYNFIDEIIISDNASNDGSSDVCIKYASEYSKIKYYRHTKNIGLLNNFIFCIGKSESIYFMWLGAHDVIPPRYIEEMVREFNSDDVVLVYSSSKFFIGDLDNVKEVVNYSDVFINMNIKKDPFERIRYMLEHEKPAMLIHGLFRRASLLRCTNDGDFKFDDDATIYCLCFEGIFKYSSRTNYYRYYQYSDISPLETWKRYANIMYERKVRWRSIYTDNYNYLLKSISKLELISRTKYKHIRSIIFKQYYIDNYFGKRKIYKNKLLMYIYEKYKIALNMHNEFLYRTTKEKLKLK